MMNDLFGTVFGIFRDIYGIPLYNFLYEEGSIFSQTGLAVILSSVAVSIIFYYVIDHPKYNSWSGWGFSMMINACICFFVTLFRITAMYNGGAMVEKNVSTGETVPIDVSEIDIVNFSWAVVIVSCFIYALVSFILKGRSVNCSHYPHFKRK